MFKKFLLGLFTVLLIIGGSNMANAKHGIRLSQNQTKLMFKKLNLKTDSELHLSGIYTLPKIQRVNYQQ